MIIIQNVNQPLPRLAQTTLRRAAAAMPAVVVTGPRQCGKSTLVRELEPAGLRAYFTLDDFDTLAQARTAPDDLVYRAERLTLDEVQRAPDLLIAVKSAIDQERTAGRFLITGSANLLLMKQVAESLAGRAFYLTLRPMTRSELAGRGGAGLWPELCSAPDKAWPDVVQASLRPRSDWREFVRRGGFPTPALQMSNAEERRFWFAGYVQTYLERDLQDLAAISALPDFRRLMQAAAIRVGGILNQTELGRDVALPQPSVHRYLNLLETSYQLIRLPAYAVNRTKRLIKSPKTYWGDTGLGAHLSGATELHGGFMENLVLLDLLAWSEAQLDSPQIFYWRTASNQEVDLVIDHASGLIPIEVKTATRARVADASHLQAFRAEYGKHARAGLLLHNGDSVEWLAPGILAAPWWKVI